MAKKSEVKMFKELLNAERLRRMKVEEELEEIRRVFWKLLSLHRFQEREHQ